MRNVSLPTNVSILTALQAHGQFADGINPSTVIARTSQAQRTTTPPKWIGTIMLWELSSGKHGMHAMHMCPELLTAMIVKGKASLGLVKLAMAHPDRSQAGMFAAIAQVSYSKVLSGIEGAPMPAAANLIDEVETFLRDEVEPVKK